MRIECWWNWFLRSISPRIYAKLLHAQILKEKKRLTAWLHFLPLLGSECIKAACKMLVKSAALGRQFFRRILFASKTTYCLVSHEQTEKFHSKARSSGTTVQSVLDICRDWFLPRLSVRRFRKWITLKIEEQFKVTYFGEKIDI